MASKPQKPLRMRITEVIPGDSRFTLPELIALLGGDVSPANVRTTLNRLIQKGEIVRVKRGSKDSPACYAAARLERSVNRLNSVPQIEAAEMVLGQLARPVTISELIQEMGRRGFTPNRDEATLKRTLLAAMRVKDQFMEKDKLWSLNDY